MKLRRILALALLVFLLSLGATTAGAGDFGWERDFNLRAGADPSDFRVRLAARFNVGDTQISAVLSNVKGPSAAYIVLRLGEMSSKPPDYVIEKYKSNKGKGWGVLAKSLGIKPGSKEFHALKRGDDLYTDGPKGKGKGRGKGKDKG